MLNFSRPQTNLTERHFIADRPCRHRTLCRVVPFPFGKHTTQSKMATTMTMSACATAPLAARKAFGSKAKLASKYVLHLFVFPQSRARLPTPKALHATPRDL
jgi:hypothetical protein|tara:strand:- start:2309 stop:2614 length:306 start_codon:yes stop_codon:yes gene_type:complete